MTFFETLKNTLFGKKEKTLDEENPLIKQQKKSFDELINEIKTEHETLTNNINGLKDQIKNDFLEAALQIKNKIDQLQTTEDAENFLGKLKTLNVIVSEYKTKDEKYENNVNEEIDFEKIKDFHNYGYGAICVSLGFMLFGLISDTNNNVEAVPYFVFSGIFFLTGSCIILGTQYQKGLWEQNRMDKQKLLEEFENINKLYTESTPSFSTN